MVTTPIPHDVAIRLLMAHSGRTGLPWIEYHYKVKVLEERVRLITDAWIGRRVYKGKAQWYICGDDGDVRRTRLWSGIIEREYKSRFRKVKTKFQIDRDGGVE